MFLDYFTLHFCKNKRPLRTRNGLNAKLGSHHPESDRLLIHFELSAYYFEEIMQIRKHIHEVV